MNDAAKLANSQQPTANSQQPKLCSDVKVIAYYLPQFHTTPENDKAWGKGFTEWTNVKKAIPLFDGHYQPRVPLNGNYYCLLDEGVMESQAELAKKYGIHGFCYYHYWFANGHKLLHKPLEYMLHHPSVDIPFCLCWANENWTRRWDGGSNEIIVAQDYESGENLDRHIDYLCEFFADPRYIKIDGKPLFVLYKPVLIPNIHERMIYFRERVQEKGFSGIFIAAQHPSYLREDHFLDFGVDAYIQTEPSFSGWWYPSLHADKVNVNKKHRAKENLKYILGCMGLLKSLQRMKSMFKPKQHNTLDYDHIWNAILSYHPQDSRLIAGAFKDWDNTPRYRHATPCVGATPEKFGYYMRQLVRKVIEEYSSPYIFINAWNEWGEGSYLEPDERYGYAYLEALRDALTLP